MTYFPVADTVGSGSLTAANQAVTVTVLPGQTSWTVQATGTFVGTFQSQVTLDGTNWIGVNSRQADAGTLKSTFTAPGLFRGTAGGVAQFRVICTAYTSGTAVISVRLGAGTGAIFSNNIILVQNPFQYYASTAGGNTGFNTNTSVISISSAGGNVALFRNPSGSTVDAYIESISVGTSVSGRMERFYAPTVSSVTTPTTNINRGGSSNVALCRMYVGGTSPQFVTSANGTSSKVSYLTSNSSECLQEAGSLIVRPGQDYLLRFDPDSTAASNTSVEVMWWESGVLT